MMTATFGLAIAMPTLGVVGAVGAPAQAAAEATPYKVLVVGKTLGFRHSSIDEGTRAVIKLGQENGFTVDVFDPQQTADSVAPATYLTSTPFTSAADLGKYKTLIFISTVDGTNAQNPATPTLLNPSELAALQGYIRGGGGFVGIHAASDSMHTVPWYSQLIGGGARFLNHPAQQNVIVHTEDPTHPSTQGIPDPWVRFDELYNFTVNPRPSVHVLQTLVEASYNPGSGAMGEDHPISWCQNFEGGRSWYQGMGHTEASFSDPLFLKNMLGGIEWAAGQVEGNCTTFNEVSNRIDELVAGNQLASHVAASLRDRLQKAMDAYNNDGSEKRAISYLQQFIDRANNQIKGDADDTAVRNELIDKAQDLINWLTAKDAGERNILVFTKNVGKGDRHLGTQSAGVADIESLGKQLGWNVKATNNAALFTDSSLADYDAVVFLNTSGDVLNDAQQAAFERYIKAGGGFVGTHSAIETEPDWQFFTDLIGTRATSEVPVQDSLIKVVDRVHPASAGLPERWQRNGAAADGNYNFAQNVRGQQHVLATLDERTAGFTGGTMGYDHPAIWCQDFRGGRSFYTGTGHTVASFNSPQMRSQLGGAIAWAAGGPGDCGATVLKNFQMTVLATNQSDPTQLGEPIGFDVLPDRRVLTTSRVNAAGDGQVRLIDPDKGTNEVIASIPVYHNSEDGLYGPAIDNDFASNHWVYLYYAPVVMDGVSQLTGKPFGDPVTHMTPDGNSPATGPDKSTWDVWVGYFQLSRFKLVEASGSDAAHLDMGSEQKILKVEVDRGACCHVAGDIDFDKNNNLWFVTGDDTAAGSGNAGGFGQYSDMTLTESQTVRTQNAGGGTYTITFQGQTTAPIAYNANGATVQAALEALSNIDPGDVSVTGNNGSTGNLTVQFRGQYYQVNVDQMTTDASGLTASGTTAATAPVNTTLQGGWIYGPWTDARRSAQNTNDLRGKVNRIHVEEDGSYTIPAGNLFAPGTANTRPEIYAMGFRNPFRIQVDDHGWAYVTDYSPDSRTPQDFRGPAGTGRVEIVKRPTNYGWPLCYSPNLPYYRWNFNLSVPLDDPPQHFECDNPNQGPENTSRWNTGLTHGPKIGQPDIWYSYNDNLQPNPLGTPCFAYYNGSGGTCPQLFPELGSGGVGPQGAAPYVYDPANTNPTKFPAYYDNGFILGEFTRDWLRDVKLDSSGNVLKINDVLNCGQDPQPFLCDNPMDMQFGPDGDYYLLTYGDGFFRANPDAKLVRFEYVKDQVASPTAVVSANVTSGPSPLTVNFSSAGSSDPNGGDLTYAWDFDGNGTVDSTEANPSHTYTGNGTFTARLTVTNAAGKTGTATTTITSGNTAPKVTITTPINGGFFSFGDKVPWSVTVTDPEDGAIDCSKVNVTFVLGHDQHGHAEDTFHGCSGVYQTDAEGANHAGGHLFGAFSASYTDNGGLVGQGQVSIQQRFQEAEAWELNGVNVGFVNDPSPIGVGQNIQVSGIDDGDSIALDPVNFVNMTGVDLRVSGGSAALNGTVRANMELHLDAPDGPLAATIPVLNGPNNNMNTQHVDVNFPSGTHKIYLVFKATGAQGQPTSNLFNLNWLRFTGQGVSATP
jgi:type 1 glutamine amidotransferase/PKD repeat protein